MILATGSRSRSPWPRRRRWPTKGVAVRVVSMPSTNVFDRQDAAYKAGVLPVGLPRVAVEAGTTDGWVQITSASRAA